MGTRYSLPSKTTSLSYAQQMIPYDRKSIITDAVFEANKTSQQACPIFTAEHTAKDAKLTFTQQLVIADFSCRKSHY
jgi:hypothetical protein